MKENHSGKIIGLLFNTTAWIVGPVLVGTLIGKWLDKKFQTDPWLFLVSVGVCFSITIFSLIKVALKEFKKIEKEDHVNREK